MAAVGSIDEVELEYRRHIGAAFQAAACLYVLLVAPELPSLTVSRFGGIGLPNFPDAGDLAAAILHHLSFIPINSPLFKFITWPLFLAGVETAHLSQRMWVLDRLRDMRDLCPWGMLTSTMETLVEIWRIRDNLPMLENFEIDDNTLTRKQITSRHDMTGNNWLLQLKGFKIDCLIV